MIGETDTHKFDIVCLALHYTVKKKTGLPLSQNHQPFTMSHSSNEILTIRANNFSSGDRATTVVPYPARAEAGRSPFPSSTALGSLPPRGKSPNFNRRKKREQKRKKMASSSSNVVGVHYRVGKKIGEGSFGVIFEGTNLLNNQQVAIKFVSLQSFSPFGVD